MPGVELIKNAPMAAYTTYRTGGAAEVLALPKNIDELKNILAFARVHNIETRVLGLGSNILVGGRGVKGVTICLKNMRGLKLEGDTLTANAGEPLDNIAAAAVNAGLEGMEALSGIPGSAGGAVYMNAGAYGQETFDKLVSFTLLDCEGNIKILNKSEVKYGYRRVEGLGCQSIILSATWLLAPTQDAAALKAKRVQVLAQRIEKQPLDYPSAGSVFKRPQNNFASALIDKCGLKGLRAGGAMVSPKHAGFIINYDKATPEDIKNLMQEVQTRVLAQTGVKLELEQILWGDF